MTGKPARASISEGRAVLSVVALVMLIGMLRALPAASAAARHDSNDPTQAAQYQRALALGVQAYVYGYPLLDTERVFRTSTSVNVPDGAGGGPINQFSHIRGFTNPSDRTVVAPNRDTLYSNAWLNLVPQPIVIHMPPIRGRFAVLQLLDPYTEAFASIGATGHPAGDYAVIPRGWHGSLPRGVRALRSPYTRVWIIGRTYIKNAADTPNVVRIQNEYSLTPLSKWEKHYTPRRPRRVVKTPRYYTVPGTRPGENPVAFFNALGDELKRFPPPAADHPLLAQLRAVGIGPGMHPSTDPRLDAAVRQGLHDAVAAGAKQVRTDIQAAFLASAPEHNGWLIAPTGSYGTDYTARAVVDAIGLGAPQPSLAIYPFTVTDRDLHPLTGASRYVAHFSPRDLPIPVKAFWSLTLYDAQGFFVRNRAGIYLINNRSSIRHNPDGSLDVYIQPNPPSNPGQRRNWLPSPAGRPFRLIMRLYDPENVTGILSGHSWQPPTVLPCLPTGMTRAGTRCAT